MINANELRIGITINYFGKPTTIRNYSELFNCFSSNGIIEVGIEPIPLTEEILLKAGFMRLHEDYFNDIIYIKNVVSNIEFEWGVYPIESGSGMVISNFKLKYIHQLQNLIYSLINEELEINL